MSCLCVCVSSLQNEMEVTPVLTSWHCVGLNEITCVIGFTFTQLFPPVVRGIPAPFCLSKSDPPLKSLAGQATLVWSHFSPPQWLQVKCATKSHCVGEAPRLRTTTEALHRSFLPMGLFISPRSPREGKGCVDLSLFPQENLPEHWKLVHKYSWTFKML